MQKELPNNVLWLEDGDNSRYVHRYEFAPYALGEVTTFYDYAEDGSLNYDTAVTCRVEQDDVYGEIARPV